MKGSSKVIMGATMAIVVLLAVVLGLVLVLLAELYCSLLFRRRKLNKATKPISMPERPEIPCVSEVQHAQDQSVPSPLSLGSFYAQGVLEAPRRFLFPKLPSKRERIDKGEDFDVEKQKHWKLGQFLKVKSPPHQLGLALSTSSSPSPSYISLTYPHQHSHIKKSEIEDEDEDKHDEDHSSGAKGDVDLMYISNPMYDNDVAHASRGETPFETPGDSPTGLDRSGSSGDEERAKPAASSPSSLPLSPMKELPAKACSVALKDAKCLGTSGSECNSHIGRSSSSSGSPRTSPSW